MIFWVSENGLTFEIWRQLKKTRPNHRMNLFIHFKLVWRLHGFIMVLFHYIVQSGIKMCYLHAPMSVMLILIMQQICVCRLLKWPTTPNARDSATSCSSCLPWCSSAPGWGCILCGNVPLNRSFSSVYLKSIWSSFPAFSFQVLTPSVSVVAK